MLLQKLSERLKWDLEYLLGHWGHVDNPPDPDLVAAIQAHLGNGTILDLGCGTGNTVARLRDYLHYQGVDISAIAIWRALRRYAGPRASFAVADLSEYKPHEYFDVILMSEVIYYVPPARALELLERYKPFLAEGGVFVVRIWDTAEHADHMAMIASHYQILETRHIANTERSVIVTFQ